MASPDEIAYVRLLIADQGYPPLLTDEQLDLLISQGGGPLFGAADALDAIATSEVLLGKKISSQDLTVDATAVAAELRKQAAALRARGAKSLAEINEEAWAFQHFSMGRVPWRPEATERIERW